MDLGHPAVNAVVERTARRLAAIPDAVAPRIVEARGGADVEIIVREMVLDALAELDVLCGFRTADEAA